MSLTATGVLVQLCYPYPRGVSEPAIYFEANEVDVAISEIENEQKAAAKSNKASKFMSSLDFSVSACAHICMSNWTYVDIVQINSKEGYLTKLGFHRKVSSLVFIHTVVL